MQSSVFRQCYLFCREGGWSLTGWDCRRSILSGYTGGSLWLWLLCGSDNGGRLCSPVFWNTLHEKNSGDICHRSTAQRKIVTRAFHMPCYFRFVDSLTLFGVWMGDRASRSVMGNSRPRLLRSSYTYTTPDREGELRNASAHDCVWKKEGMTAHDENDWFCIGVHGPKQRLHVKRTRRPEEPHARLQCYCSCEVFKSRRSLKITLLSESVAIIESNLSKL